MASRQYQKKQENEREVFRRFACGCPLDIHEESIESRAELEPDILCEIVGQGPVAFELTRVEAQEYRAAQAKQYEADCKRREFEEEILKYPQLVERYRGAYIFLDKPELSVKEIIEILETAPHDCEELFLIEKGITLERDDGNQAPWIGVDSVEILHAILKHIRAKFDKVADGTLQSPHPIEILAYFDGLWAKNINWPNKSVEFQNDFAELLTNSRIRRVWIYDPRADVMRFVYPST